MLTLAAVRLMSVTSKLNSAKYAQINKTRKATGVKSLQL